jgi:hypothetical protein
MSSTESKGNDLMKKAEEKAKSWGIFSNPKEEAVRTRICFVRL